MNIALCITDLGIGGAERCLAELALRVDRSRFTPVVYCLGPRPPEDAPSLVPVLERADIEVHCLGGRGIRHVPLVERRLRRLLAAQRPQITQSFMFHANVVSRIAARRARLKNVLSAIRVAERGARWHLWLDWLTEGWVDRYVCVSQSVARFSRETGRLPAEKLVVVPNGIDAQGYPAVPGDLTQFGIAAGRRAIVFVGRLERQNGLDWFLRTAPAWMAGLPDCDLLLVGAGPLRSSLEETAEALGIVGRVHFAGWRPDVPEILAAAALLVLPSAWEGMPNVVLEAMASRRAVVASDVEGVRELLGPAADRQTVRHGDSAGLVEKLTTILGDPTEAASLGVENRRRVEEVFSMGRMVAAYEDLWTSLAGG